MRLCFYVIPWFVRPLPERCRYADLGIKSPPAQISQITQSLGDRDPSSSRCAHDPSCIVHRACSVYLCRNHLSQFYTYIFMKFHPLVLSGIRVSLGGGKVLLKVGFATPKFDRPRQSRKLSYRRARAHISTTSVAPRCAVADEALERTGPVAGQVLFTLRWCIPLHPCLAGELDTRKGPCQDMARV